MPLRGVFCRTPLGFCGVTLKCSPWRNRTSAHTHHQRLTAPFTSFTGRWLPTASYLAPRAGVEPALTLSITCPLLLRMVVGFPRGIAVHGIRLRVFSGCWVGFQRESSIGFHSEDRYLYPVQESNLRSSKALILWSLHLPALRGRCSPKAARHIYKAFTNCCPSSFPLALHHQS